MSKKNNRHTAANYHNFTLERKLLHSYRRPYVMQETFPLRLSNMLSQASESTSSRKIKRRRRLTTSLLPAAKSRRQRTRALGFARESASEVWTMSKSSEREAAVQLVQGALLAAGVLTAISAFGVHMQVSGSRTQSPSRKPASFWLQNKPCRAWS